MQADTLHMLHRVPHIIKDGLEIAKDIYWGGSYDQLKEMVLHEGSDSSSVKLFLGYSGWAPAQLEREVKEGTWLIADATDRLLFDTPPGDIWKKAIEHLGRKYSYLANMPTDPQLN